MGWHCLLRVLVDMHFPVVANAPSWLLLMGIVISGGVYSIVSTGGSFPTKIFDFMYCFIAYIVVNNELCIII